MKINQKAGKIIGLLFLIQFILGIVFNLVLLGPILYTEDFLSTVSANSNSVIFSVLLGIVLSIIGITIAIGIQPFFRLYHRHAGVWYLVFCVIGFTATLIDCTVILSIISISEEFVKAKPETLGYLESLGYFLSEMRGWIHMLDMLLGSLTFSVFYYTLYQSKLIPRVISVLGCIAVMIMFVNVISSLFGSGLMILYLPVGITQIFMSVWLILKGFNTSHLIPQSI